MGHCDPRHDGRVATVASIDSEQTEMDTGSAIFNNSAYVIRRADIPMSALRNGIGMPFLRKVS